MSRNFWSIYSHCILKLYAALRFFKHFLQIYLGNKSSCSICGRDNKKETSKLNQSSHMTLVHSNNLQLYRHMPAIFSQSSYFLHQAEKLDHLFSDYSKCGKFSRNLMHSLCIRPLFLFILCGAIIYDSCLRETANCWCSLCPNCQLFQWQDCPMRNKFSLSLSLSSILTNTQHNTPCCYFTRFCL